jgi:AhpD family alkylhydroperoxidase
VSAARIAPGRRDDVGVLNWAFARASGIVAGTEPPNLFLTLGRHRRLFRGWLRFAAHLMPGGRISRRDTELVILRVGHRNECEYELAQHRRLARRAGLSDLEIARVVDGPEAPGWSERDRLLLQVTDELHDRRDLTDATWSLLRSHLDEVESIELVLLVAHYEMLATAIGTLRIEPDAPAPRPWSRRG